ncbi:MAG TPA: hypothetical protein VFZ69_07350 [Longimicrobiales bacterium]
MSTRGILLLCTAVVALAGTPARVRGQTPDTVRTVRGRIVLIAGADLHLELQTPVVLHAGDTLLVLRTNAARGRLAVVAADSARALLAFAGPAFALTRGQVVEAELRRAVPAPSAGLAPSAAETAAPPPRDTAVQPEPAAVPRQQMLLEAGPRVSGYIMSETRWARYEVGQTTVSHATPGAALSLRMTNLPGRSSVHVFARAEHRGSAASSIGAPGTQLRVYSARLESRAGPLRIGLGRLTSLHDPVGGAWDGLSLAVGTGVSVAAEAGFEPGYGTGAPSTRYPRVSLSAEAHGRSAGFRYRSSVSALRYLSDVPVGRSLMALSTRHSFTAGPFSLWGDALVEGSDTSAFGLRWGGAHAALQSSGGARVQVGYRRYHPYRVGIVDSAAVLSGRGRVDGGAWLPIGRVSLGINGAVSPGAEPRSQGGAARLHVSRLPGNLDIDVAAGLWEYGATRTIDAAAGLGFTAGRLFTRAGYRMERGSELRPDIAHEIEGDATVLLGRRSSISALAVHSLAQAASGTRLELRLTWGF